MSAIIAIAEKTCPLCHLNGQRRFERHGIWICDCTGCGHQYADLNCSTSHVAATYGDDYFHGGKAGYPDYVAEGEGLRQRGHWYAKKLARFTRPARLLDVGAAAGFILSGFVDQGWEGEGVEPNPAMAEYGAEKLGLRIHAASLEDFESPAPFDLVTLIQVISHFVDPLQAIQRAASLTKKGGHCLVETWDCGSLTARLFGSGWHEYSPPSVLHWFTRKSLARVFNSCGFQEIASGRPSKWISGAHAKSLLEYKTGSGLLGSACRRMLRLIPDRAMFPYPAEDLFWMLFRRTDDVGQAAENDLPRFREF